MAKFALCRRTCGRIDYYCNGTTVRGRKGMGPAVVWLRRRAKPGGWVFLEEDYNPDNQHPPIRSLFEAFCANMMPVQPADFWPEIYRVSGEAL